MTVDLNQLWNFSDPEASERAFRNALQHASGDDALILSTQIARTLGIARDGGPRFAVTRAVTSFTYAVTALAAGVAIRDGGGSSIVPFPLARSISSSVSGRGISTAGETVNKNFRQTVSLAKYWTGTW